LAVELSKFDIEYAALKAQALFILLTKCRFKDKSLELKLHWWIGYAYGSSIQNGLWPSVQNGRYMSVPLHS